MSNNFIIFLQEQRILSTGSYFTVLTQTDRIYMCLQTLFCRRNDTLSEFHTHTEA